MASIPLRQYNREIEGMIDSGQIEEAIAHCRHILQSYPKHIQTYRLLGKTYLESQRYTDASDIFQRLLSVVPDDFVAHVGMSIIREDENNLDAAIWHMERAFETQPSNAAIQEELRRLYGRRDGMEPPKIRLTRGALARMYARGNLYEQAIAELRAAISEDPQRVDLHVLLAQMYFHAGKRVEAIEACNKITNKFPYCLEANRLLAVLLPETDHADEIEGYRQRLVAMDPYYASTTPKALSTEDVPENTVTTERLVYRPGQTTTGAPEQPAWASSLGVAFEKEGTEQLPEWLQEDETPKLIAEQEKAPQEASPFSWDNEITPTDEETAPPVLDEAIPDWMKDAGWQPSTGEAVESPMSFAEEETDGEIAKGEIPDWLMGMAPEGALDEELPSLGEEESENVLPWLDEKEPGPTDTIITWLEETKPEVPTEIGAEAATPTEETEQPDWLHEEELPASTEAVSDKSQPADEEQLPSWLADLEQAKEVPSGITDWLRSSALPPETPTETPSAPESATSTPPDFADQDAALAWLESLAVQHGAKEEELITRPEERLDTPPDWVHETVPAEELTPTLETEPPGTLEAAEGAEIPDWLREMAPSEETTPALEAEPTMPSEAAEESELPDWLSAMRPSEQVDSTTAAESPIPDEAAEAADLPDWLVNIAPDGQELPSAEIEAPVEPEVAEEGELPSWLSELETTEEPIIPAEIETPSAQTDEASLWLHETEATTPEISAPAETTAVPSLPDMSDQDAALAWLESLAMQHGAKEEELITKPEERLETPPEWVQEQVAPESPEEVTPAMTSGESELPAWLQEMEPEEVIAEPVSEAPVEAEPAEEVPAWLQEMATEEAAPEPVVEVPVEAEPVEEVPAWLKEMEPEEVIAEPVVEAPVEAEPVEEVPAWLKEEKITPEPVSEAPVEAAPAEEAPSWLQEETTSQPVAEPAVVVADDYEAILAEARRDMDGGQSVAAASKYSSLVKKGQRLDTIIRELQDALYRFPVDIDVWQTLGDAYMRNDNLQEALDAYTKAEELLR